MIRRIQVKYIVIKVRRNPNNGHRSEFNADKTKLLRPNCYDHPYIPILVTMRVSVFVIIPMKQWKMMMKQY